MNIVLVNPQNKLGASNSRQITLFLAEPRLQIILIRISGLVLLPLVHENCSCILF